MFDLIGKIPIVNFLPHIFEAFDALDDDTKKKYAEILLKAGMKAAKKYAEKD